MVVVARAAFPPSLSRQVAGAIVTRAITEHVTEEMTEEEAE
jgi:hypothetical protein